MSDIISQKAKRPLSPHLQVYKLPMTALMSISHRASGVVLILGTILVTAFFLAAAYGPDEYNRVLDLAETIYGKIILVGWSAALFYHMCNGTRHMLWDMGFGLNLKGAKIGNFIVLLSAAALTAGTWVLACGCWKGWM